MTDQEYQTTCREAVYEWMVAQMKEWIGNHSKGFPDRTFDMNDFAAMLELEAPEVFIAMLKHAQKFIPSVEQGVVVDGN